MQAVTKLAHRWKNALEQVAHLPTKGFKLSISKRHNQPYAVGNIIYLPAVFFDSDEDFFELAVPSFKHELQHVHDTKMGLDPGKYEVEARARRAEKKPYRRSRKFKENKLGRHSIGAVSLLVDDIVKWSKNFIGLIKLVPENVDKSRRTSRITIQDVAGRTRSIPIEVSFSWAQLLHPYAIYAFCHAKEGRIFIYIDFRDYNPSSLGNLIPWDNFKRRLKFVLYHELGHAERAPDISYSRLHESKFGPGSGIQYYRLPMELDANISAMVSICREYVEDSGKQISYKEFFDMMETYYPIVYKSYKSPKWRKKIIKRLAREGIILERLGENKANRNRKNSTWPPNKELFRHYLEYGLVVEDVGDGSWGWSNKGKMISGDIRLQLSNLLYNESIPSFMIKVLKKKGIDEKGYLDDIYWGDTDSEY